MAFPIEYLEFSPQVSSSFTPDWAPINPCSKVSCRCLLGKSAKTIMVTPRGSNQPLILLVGECPGTDEDKKGEAFIGPAGKILDEILETLQIPPVAVRRTNVIRCKPSAHNGYGVRPPEKHEIDACIPFLHDEILTLNPKVIVTLGNTAMGALTGRKQITVMRGKELKVKLKASPYPQGEFTVIPALHPSFVLRQGGKGHGNAYTLLMEDLAHAWKFVGGKVSDDGTSYSMLKTPSEFEEYARSVVKRYRSGEIPGIVADIETTTLDAYDPNGILLCVGFSTREKEGVVLPIFHKDSPISDSLSQKRVLSVLAKLLDLVPVINANIGFDMLFLAERYGIQIRSVLFDTMLAHHTLYDNSRSNRLEDMAASILGMGGWKSSVHSVLASLKKESRHYGNVPLEILYPYAAKDADATYRLFVYLQKKLIEEGLYGVYYKYSNRSIKSVVRMERNGVKIDPDKLALVDEEYQVRLIDIKRQLSTFDSVRRVERRLGKSFESHLTRHLRMLFFDGLKLPAFRKSEKTCEPSTDEDTRDKIIALCSGANPTDLGITKEDAIWMADGSLGYNIKEVKEIIELINNYSKTTKLHSAFGSKLITHVKSDGLIHAKFNLGATRTGRFSCSNPNLQQIPKGDIIKTVFVPRFRNWLIASIDASQMELRVMASVSKEQGMIDAFIQKRDLHRFTASCIYKKEEQDITSRERSVGKTLNFGIGYGAGPIRVSAETGLTLEESEALIASFFEMFPGVKSYMQSAVDEACETGMVYAPTGHRRIMVDIKSANRKARKSGENQAGNFPIQGAAAKLMESILQEFSEWVEKLGLQSKLFATVHDSFSVDCPPKEVLPVLYKLKYLMEVWTFDQNPWLLVPIQGDAVIGTSLGEHVEVSSLELISELGSLSSYKATLSGEHEVLRRIFECVSSVDALACLKTQMFQADDKLLTLTSTQEKKYHESFSSRRQLA